MSAEPADAIDAGEAALDGATEAVISSDNGCWTGVVCEVNGDPGGSELYCWHNSWPCCWGIRLTDWRAW